MKKCREVSALLSEYLTSSFRPTLASRSKRTLPVARPASSLPRAYARPWNSADDPPKFRSRLVKVRGYNFSMLMQACWIPENRLLHEEGRCAKRLNLRYISQLRQEVQDGPFRLKEPDGLLKMRKHTAPPITTD